MTWKLKEIINIHIKQKKLYNPIHRSVLFFVPFSDTIQHWFGVTGLHDMEAIREKSHYLVKIYLQNKNLTN